MMFVNSDAEFIAVTRREIIDICSESPELTELFGNFILKAMRAYKKHREFAPEVFKMSDRLFAKEFSGCKYSSNHKRV